ncbi:hypothetical protein [Nonomuraea roseoviolacea]|uniref:Uncharacterized protein n=1 Tax=Nonomuraea roseoviolacea subsp. carminata TaxID=160689 RepID=A0ABT1JZY4_9ACTN|nr:hypothetical protein [Nonomuraea roseoviolacea]MCP2346929.1 hypothetical protein [Nonomuraea roseoviolacea subsp. carminata]
MKPEDTRVWRKGLRTATKANQAGRPRTRPTKTRADRAKDRRRPFRVTACLED